jgi:aspartokinase
MQDRSVAFAKKMGINFSISSAFGENSGAGTRVANAPCCDESHLVGLTYKTDLTLISVVSEANIFDELLIFFSQNHIDVNFVKHSRLSNSWKFFDEIAITSLNYRLLNNLHPAILFSQKVSTLENLTRIDIVGTGLEYSPWLNEILALVKRQEIFRSEYGKNGLSFLVKESIYKDVLNKIHGIIFG